MKKLPVGIQTFAKMREDDAVYIDKAALTVQLINTSNSVFLSRPRRFGKSLFVDTLKELFEGNRQLFTGLAAETMHDWSSSWPVIRLAFGGGDFSTRETLGETVREALAENEEALGVRTDAAGEAACFNQLIHRTAQKYERPVVVLVDEYDKPLLDNLTRPDYAEEVRTFLSGFYAVIKNNDHQIRFAFLTGVSRFSKVSIFSGLNNLRDISLMPQYGSICGYTWSEMEESFADRLDGVDRAELERWYDGYNFLGENVYNPFDILLFFDGDKKYRSYWFQTGTTSSLVKMIKVKRSFLPDLNQVFAGSAMLDSFDIENIDLITMLYQTGYLTIKEEVGFGTMVNYWLGFPNQNCSVEEIARCEGFYASVMCAWLSS